LKLMRERRAGRESDVAPRTGAWIETRKEFGDVCAMPSPPARGRGLKPQCHQTAALNLRVAPRTGAWIETGMNRIINRVV